MFRLPWLMAIVWCSWMASASGGTAKISKVLPHYLDHQGRHTLSPSLYERDAYQDYLRKNPQLRSAIRFDVLWKAKGFKEIRLRLELRTGELGASEGKVLERVLKPGRFGRWSSITFGGEAFKQSKEIIAWRVTLWENQRLLAEQKSLLW